MNPSAAQALQPPRGRDQPGEERPRRRRQRLVATAAITGTVVLVGLLAALTLARTSASPTIRPPHRPWATITVAKGISNDYRARLQLPGTRYAYLISLQLADVDCPPGRLERDDLATGHVSYGPTVPGGSSLGVVDGAMYVVEPRTTSRLHGPGAPSGCDQSLAPVPH